MPRPSETRDGRRDPHGAPPVDGKPSLGVSSLRLCQSPPARVRLDHGRWPGECRRPVGDHAMKLSSQLSPNGDGLPAPADPHRLALGFGAWEAALAEAEDAARAACARAWSKTRWGQCLLAAIFGNSPFLSSVAAAEWDFLTRLVAEGADVLFEEIASATEKHVDSGENRAALMRRLRIARRRVALVA